MYTYDLESSGGRTRAGLETIIPVVILIVCGYQFITTENYIYGVGVVVSGFWLILVTGAAWWHTLDLQRIERMKAEGEARQVYIPDLVKRRLDIEYARTLIDWAHEIGMLDNERLRLLLMVARDVEFNIDGQRVIWTVNHEAIEPSFSLVWLDQWARAEGDELPKINDWHPDCGFTRDEYRRSANAINSALVKVGAAKYSGGPIPGRWTVPQEQRQGYLKMIGLYIAASWAEAGLTNNE